MDDTGDLAQQLKTVPVAAVGCSISMNFGTTANFTIQTHVPQDEPDHVWDRAVDRMMRAANRQRAIFELPMFHVELEAIQKKFDTDEADYATRCGQRLTAHESAKKLLSEAEMELASTRKGYETDHIARGKQGAYRPQAAQATNLKQLAEQVVRCEKAVSGLAAEGHNEDVTRKAERVAFERRRAEMERKIGDAQRLIGASNDG